MQNDMRKFNNQLIIQIIDQNKNTKVLKSDMSTERSQNKIKIKNYEVSFILDRQDITGAVQGFYHML